MAQRGVLQHTLFLSYALGSLLALPRAEVKLASFLQLDDVTHHLFRSNGNTGGR